MYVHIKKGKKEGKRARGAAHLATEQGWKMAEDWFHSVLTSSRQKLQQ